jgi:tellurite resistance protein
MAEDAQQQLADAESAATDPFALLLVRLGEQLPELDDNARELILESAFRVACSDGEIEPEEDLQLRALAEVLAINEGVLELEIARFQRQMLAKAAS